MGELTHLDQRGNAIMVDVSQKEPTSRMAVARGRLWAGDAVLSAIRDGAAAKGDVLAVARVAGILAAKRTAEWIPLCHPLQLASCALDFRLEEGFVEAVCTVKVAGRTGVEMEALTGVSAALLTVYDMCKAIDKTMTIGEIHLARKDGGKSGVFIHERE